MIVQLDFGFVTCCDLWKHRVRRPGMCLAEKIKEATLSGCFPGMDQT